MEAHGRSERRRRWGRPLALGLSVVGSLSVALATSVGLTASAGLVASAGLTACSDASPGSTSGLEIGATGEVAGGLDVAPGDASGGDLGPDQGATGPCGPGSDGLACDDGDPCTVDDQCSAGVCVGGTNKVCDAEGPCRPGTCGSDGACIYEDAEDGAPCSVACFTEATCQAGHCQAVAGTERPCPTPDNPCVDELRCDSATGACSVEIYALDGAVCDTDDNVCTLERCDGAGHCVDTGAVETCAEQAQANPCWTYTCTYKTGCVKSLFIEGASCNDNNACSVNDVCRVDELGQKVCMGDPVALDDLNPCTDDACVDGVISHTPVDGVVCPVNDPCSPTGICQGGVCAPATPCECQVDADCAPPVELGLCAGERRCDWSSGLPHCVPVPDTEVVCATPVEPCLKASCDPATGGCSTSPKPDGVVCDDGDACTAGDACQGGACAGTPVSCDDGVLCNGIEICDPALGCQPGVLGLDDGVACTVDACDETVGVTHTPDDGLCDDGDACNGAETCDPTLGCQAGAAVPTDDGVTCTVDTCDPVTGAVTHTPDHGACDDGLQCNGAERCDPALGCLPGVAPETDDGVPCTVDVCDEDLGVLHLPADAACSNGDACDGEEVCDPTLGCQPGPAPAGLDDGVACTVDACDPATGAVTHTPDDGACDDHNPCTGVETCDASLGCQAGAPVVCDDGLFCNGAESCDVKDGLCYAGAAPVVDDGVHCTLDFCDEDLDVVVHQPMDGLCGAGEICDPVEGCVPGASPLDPTGTWGLDQVVQYLCKDPYGLGITYVDLNYASLSFADNGTSLSVMPKMNSCCTMSGGSASGGDIDANCSCPGGCLETYTLTGTFSDADHWAGTLHADFTGDCGVCTSQTFDLSATRQ